MLSARPSSSWRRGCSKVLVESRRQTEPPSPSGSQVSSSGAPWPARCMCPKPQRMTTANSSRKAGSNDARPSCAMPISGVAIDWCAPPSGASVTPDGVATSMKRAFWQQALAEDGMRQAKRGQHREQVHLGDAEFQMLPGRGGVPVERRRDTFGLERVNEFLARKQPAPVHPAPKVGRDRHIRGGGDDVWPSAIVGGVLSASCGAATADLGGKCPTPTDPATFP